MTYPIPRTADITTIDDTDGLVVIPPTTGDNPETITFANLKTAIGSGGATPLSDTTPQGPGTAAAGSADAASRGDHIHPRQTDITTSEIRNNAITNQKINDNAVGTSKINDDAVTADKLSSGLEAAIARIPSANPAANKVWGTGSSGGPTWVDKPSGGGGSTPLANANPQPLGTAAPGTGTAASRGDHVHPRQTNIGTTEIANDAITNLKLNNDAVSTAKIVNGAITPEKLQSAIQTGLARIPAPNPAASKVWGTTATDTTPAWIDAPSGGDTGGTGDVTLSLVWQRTSIPQQRVNLGSLAVLPEAFLMVFTNSLTVWITKTSLNAAGAIGLTIFDNGANIAITNHQGSLAVQKLNSGNQTGVKVYKVLAAAGPKGDKGDPGAKGYTALTQAAYSALTNPDANTLYLIIG